MRVALLLLFILMTPFAAVAQNPTPAPAETVQNLVEIELRDGSRFVGRIVSESDSELRLVTASGTEVRIDKAQIVSRKIVSGRVRDGEFRAFDPNRTRLFFAPTGRSLSQGSGYLTAYYVVFGFAAVGITDRFTLAGGTFLVPELIGDFVYAAPKFTVYEAGSSAFSVGALAGLADRNAAGIMYGAYTRGQPDGAVTLGLGFGFAEGDVATADPVIMLGGEKALGRRTKFVGEAYLLPSQASGAVILGGIRFFGDRIAADLGLLGVIGIEDAGFPAIPWVGFAYNFGN